MRERGLSEDFHLKKLMLVTIGCQQHDVNDEKDDGDDENDGGDDKISADDDISSDADNQCPLPMLKALQVSQLLSNDSLASVHWCTNLISPVARSSSVSLALKRARLRTFCWAASALAIAANRHLYDGRGRGRKGGVDTQYLCKTIDIP